MKNQKCGKAWTSWNPSWDLHLPEMEFLNFTLRVKMYVLWPESFRELHFFSWISSAAWRIFSLLQIRSWWLSNQHLRKNYSVCSSIIVIFDVDGYFFYRFIETQLFWKLSTFIIRDFKFDLEVQFLASIWDLAQKNSTFRREVCIFVHFR